MPFLRCATWNTNGWPDPRFFDLPLVAEGAHFLFLQEGTPEPLGHAFNQLDVAPIDALKNVKVVPSLHEAARQRAATVVPHTNPVRSEIVSYFQRYQRPIAGGKAFRTFAFELISFPQRVNPRNILLIAWHATSGDAADVSNRPLMRYLMTLMSMMVGQIDAVVIGADFNSKIIDAPGPKPIWRAPHDRKDNAALSGIFHVVASVLNTDCDFVDTDAFSLAAHVVFQDEITHSKRKREREKSGQKTDGIAGSVLDYFVVLTNEKRITLSAAACWRVHPSKGSDHWGVRADLEFTNV